jgi:hypothetical protein
VSTSSVSGVDGKFWEFLKFFHQTNHAWSCQIVTINNDGDAPAYPIWYIIGPANYVRIENLTTGQSIVIAKPIPSGGMIVIDTRHRLMYGLFADAWTHDALDQAFEGIRYQDMFTLTGFDTLDSLQYNADFTGGPGSVIVNAWEWKTPGSVLFPLPVGQTSVRISIQVDPDALLNENSGSLAGEVLVEVPRRWLVA